MFLFLAITSQVSEEVDSVLLISVCPQWLTEILAQITCPAKANTSIDGKGKKKSSRSFKNKESWIKSNKQLFSPDERTKIPRDYGIKHLIK